MGRKRGTCPSGLSGDGGTGLLAHSVLPLRPFGPPPHKWGGQEPPPYEWGGKGRTGLLAHSVLPLRPFGPPPHKWGGLGARVEVCPTALSAVGVDLRPQFLAA